MTLFRLPELTKVNGRRFNWNKKILKKNEGA